LKAAEAISGSVHRLSSLSVSPVGRGEYALLNGMADLESTTS
jgi:hypothetical protein